MTIGATGELDFSAYATPRKNQAKASSELGQEAFLKLMVTQFQNQDPTKPLEPNDFLAQLAQFSNVSSLAQVSQSVAQLSETLYANQAVQASGLIGRSVLVDGNTGVLATGQPLAGAVDLPADTSTGVVRIFSEAGEIVRELPLGDVPAGINYFSWDGTTSAGNTAPPGRYRFEAFFRHAGGEQAVDTYASAHVTSITLAKDLSNSTLTTSDGLHYRLSQVKAIN